MSLNNLGLLSNNSVMNSIKALLLFYVVVVLSACAGTRAYNSTVPGVKGDVQAHKINVNKLTRMLSSYSVIHGRLKSKPDDYIEISRNGPITFFGHKDHVGAAKEVLDKSCCYDGKTSADNIVKATEWVRSLFVLDTDMQVEILLVPDAYEYQYATRYKIKDNQAKVRFAFHYYDERPVLINTRFVEEAVDTLTHELTHIYFRLSDRPAKNIISDETTASTIGVCAQTLVRNKLPNLYLSKNSASRTMSARAERDYEDTVNYMQEKLREAGLRGSYVKSVFGKIVSEMIVEKMDKKYGHSDELASEKMREFCQHIVKTRHNFELSMGIEE